MDSGDLRVDDLPANLSVCAWKVLAPPSVVRLSVSIPPAAPRQTEAVADHLQLLRLEADVHQRSPLSLLPLGACSSPSDADPGRGSGRRHPIPDWRRIPPHIALSVPVCRSRSRLRGMESPPPVRLCDQGAGDAVTVPSHSPSGGLRSSLSPVPSSGRTFATRRVDVINLDSANVVPRERREQQQRERLIATIAASIARWPDVADPSAGPRLFG